MGILKGLAVSTFNAAGLELYGHRMMESFRANWTVPLRVYSEGWSDSQSVDLLDASPWLGAFRERHKGRAFKDYRWDAVRFSHKVAAVCHAAREDLDFLIWIDGDTFTHSRVGDDDLGDLLPAREKWIAWLDRAGIYPECGFYILNCRHDRHAELLDAFEEMYTRDALFGLPEFHDCVALEHVVKSRGVATKSLSGAGYRTSHPAVNGPLGKFIDHMKGKRKQAGRSARADLRVKRGEAYWR